ncbi:MAG: serine/threonine-protein kinase, partial [Candidatus Korobacteraceae bacterium]
MPPPSIGDVFGHYRLIEQIGSGGMGVVFRAHDEQLRRDVALKILPQSLFSQETSREQFHKEALAVGRLNHPNVAMAFDFGQQNGVDYLVTEYIPGVNLDEKIGGQPLPPKMVLELGVQLLSGLAAAHREHVLHRDLKPGNIRINRDGQVKILDFGLAHLNEPVDEKAETCNLTKDMSLSGTLPYMAPELLKTEAGDERADVWAAGAVLYEMATGKRAFPDKQPSLVIDAILHYDPVRPSLLNPQISPALEAVILRALDRDRDRRYQSAGEMCADLGRLVAGDQIATETLRRTGVVELARKRRTRKLVWGLATVLLLGIAIGFLVKSRFVPQQRILAVLPIDTVGQDSATNALGLGLMETLTAKLVEASNGDSIQVVSPRDLRDQ